LIPARRLIVALVCLIAFDPFVPALQRRVERHRYEETQAFRFGNSDLFGLGPLVSYLREHREGSRPRTLFLGNSVVFGYELTAAEALPARFQDAHPETQVFNAAVNGFELGSLYLVAKATIDSVGRFFVLRGGAGAHPLLASMIPVDAADAAAFHLQVPDPVETRLQSVAGLWALYASTYRLQAGMFGTSTRQFLHVERRRISARAHAAGDGAVEVQRVRSAFAPTAGRRDELRRQDELLWRFAELAQAHGKRVVFVQIGSATPGAIGDPEAADFNAAFEPYAEIVRLTVPPALTFDGRHLTATGARRVAEALGP
jgi:hypothetical protein